MSEEATEVPTSRAAVVTAGVVTNVIVVSVAPEEDPFEIEGSEIVLIVQGIPVDIGWLWNGSEFQSPPDEGE
jgi:hypothetical protein